MTTSARLMAENAWVVEMERLTVVKAGAVAEDDVRVRKAVAPTGVVLGGQFQVYSIYRRLPGF